MKRETIPKRPTQRVRWVQTKAARRVPIFTLKHERNEDFPKEQEGLKEPRREKGGQGDLTMDTQGVGSGTKAKGKTASDCPACIS